MFRRMFLKAMALVPAGLFATKSTAVPTAKQTFPPGMDAVAWARSFITHQRANSELATDEGAMIGWFANAIIAGFDEARRRYDDGDVEWFTYDAQNGFDTSDTEEKALAFARDLIDDCNDGEWSEDVHNICVGKVIHRTRQTNVVTKEMLDDEGCCGGKYYPSHNHCDYFCDYEIGPKAT